jgi:hypothetical protein
MERPHAAFDRRGGFEIAIQEWWARFHLGSMSYRGRGRFAHPVPNMKKGPRDAQPPIL